MTNSTQDSTAGSLPALHCYRHPDRETYVSCTRCSRPICPSCMRPASVGFHCPDEAAAAAPGRRLGRGARGPGARVARTVFGGREPGVRPLVTYWLIGLNVLVFLVTAAGGTSLGLSGGSSPLYARFSIIPPEIAAGQYYRLLTAMFLHFGLLHIATNMYVLYIVGPPLERALGRSRYLALYLLAGLGGSAASYAFGPLNLEGAGASGAVFGLFGAYVVVAHRLRADLRPILITVALNLVLSLTIPNIDWHAHVGGLVLGAAIGAGYVYAPRGRYRWGLQVLTTVLAAAVVVVVTELRTQALTHALTG